MSAAGIPRGVSAEEAALAKINITRSINRKLREMGLRGIWKDKKR